MVKDDEGRYLLVQSRRRGWEFPGGFVGADETIRDASKREVKEESGLAIQLTRYLGCEQDMSKLTIVFIFAGKPVGGTLDVGDFEVEDAGFFSYEEAMRLIRMERFRERFNRCLREQELPFLVQI